MTGVDQCGNAFNTTLSDFSACNIEELILVFQAIIFMHEFLCREIVVHQVDSYKMNDLLLKVKPPQPSVFFSDPTLLTGKCLVYRIAGKFGGI